MVNKIDGNNYYDYQKLKNVNIPDAGEKFSLDYKQGELQSEPKDDKEKDDKTAAEQNPSADKSGVKLEISRQGQSAASGRAKSSAKTSASQDILGIQSIIDSVREFISSTITAVKDFFYNLWYDTPRPEADVSKSATDTELYDDELNEFIDAAKSESSPENTEKDDFSDVDARTAYSMNNEKLDRRIQPYLKNGDLNNVMNLLTDNGRKTIARNSSLLTYYDRTGRMVEPNASDRERILHGDINTRKL